MRTPTYRLLRYACGHVLRSHDDRAATRSDLARLPVQRLDVPCRWCARLAEARREWAGEPR